METPPPREPASERAGHEDQRTLERVAEARPDDDLEDARVHNVVKARLFGGPAVPLQLDRFTLLECLGRGGAGEVWAAYDPRLDRRVAIKVLHARGEEASSTAASRLVREAQVAGRLSHPNIVSVFDVGVFEGRVHLAMEFIEGPDLARWLAETQPATAAVLDVFIQAGRGLAEAHRHGVVHRDFKPANVMLQLGSGTPRARVVDFGLASQDRAVSDSNDDSARVAAESDEVLTKTGQRMGTPAYMAPEQRAGAQVDARSDQFAFCVSLFEALAGYRPIDHHGLPATQSAEATPPDGSRIPARVRGVLLRGLSIDPDDRWPSMDALLDALRRASVPWSRRWLALGAAVGLTALGVGVGLVADVAAPCRGAPAELDGVWDEARREQVNSAILSTQLPNAPETWERVERSLDEYAEAWVDQHTRICEATNIRHEQSASIMDLRMGCMQRCRIELREAVTVLASANHTRVHEAVNLVVGLPSLSRCDDVEMLRARLPPPEGAAAAQEVEVLRERLVLARALSIAGEFDQGLVEADATVQRAEALGYKPLLAEAWHQRGVSRQLGGMYSDAEEDLQRAYLLAAELGHHEVAATSVSHLTFVVGHDLARYERGRQWGLTALALAKGERDDPGAEADALSNIGSVLLAEGKLDDSRDHFERALETKERALGPEHPEVALALHNLGATLAIQGAFDEALARFHRSLAIRARAFGDHHPRVAESLDSIGGVLRATGEYERALEHHEQALAIVEPALGSEHARVAVTLNSMGDTLRAQGRLDDALVCYRRALSIREQALGPEHPLVAKSLNDIGAVLDIQGAPDEALEHHRRALAIREQVLDPMHVDVARSLNSVAVTMMRTGALDQALEYFRRALTIFERALGPRHLDVAMTLNNTGKALHLLGDHDLALDHYRRALAVRETALGPRHPDVAKSLNNIGTVLGDQGRHDEELEHYRRALAIKEATLGAGHPSVARTLGNIGFVHLTRGEHEEALARYQRALSIEERAAGPLHPAIMNSLLGVADAALALDDDETAREHATRAVAIGEATGGNPAGLAEARFLLARALWPRAADRAKARALAVRARDAYAELGAAGAGARTEVEEWIAGHPGR